jgi:predicted RND superfamily exporter protein
MTRSIYTSLTTFATIACLYIVGVPSIREFALPLMVGIVAGAFSSVCLTGPIWYVLRIAKDKRDQAAEKAAQESLEKFQIMAAKSPAAFEKNVEKCNNLIAAIHEGKEKLDAPQPEQE